MGWNIFRRRQSTMQQLGVFSDTQVAFDRHAEVVVAQRFGGDAPNFDHIPEPYKGAHGHSFRNEKEVLASETCGCFYCMSTFSPLSVKDWVSDGEKTAMCPNCGIDSVIGSAAGYPLTSEFLQEMNKHWF